MPYSPKCTDVWAVDGPVRRPRWTFRNFVFLGSSIV